MNTSRRRFLQSSGALVIAFNLPAAVGPASAADDKILEPNAYIRIDGKGQVTMLSMAGWRSTISADHCPTIIGIWALGMRSLMACRMGVTSSMSPR